MTKESVPMLGGIGPMEVIVVMALALLVLGPKRLPSAGRSLGEGLRNFKRGLRGSDRDDPASAEPAGELTEAQTERPAT